MAQSEDCVNCTVLKKQCLELKEEINTLTLKLDRLINAVFYDKNNVASQTTSSVSDFACQTQSNFNTLDTSQTSVVPLLQSNLQSNDCDHNSTDSRILSHSMGGMNLDSLLCGVTSINDSSDNALLDIYINADPPVTQNPIPHIVMPYISLPNHPFYQFDLSKLEQDIQFDHKLHNRSVSYFGDYSYSYNNIVHQPCPLPSSENYIHQILNHVNQVMPDIKFNSILLTKYSDGSDSIGYHSDNESEIEPNSDIVTISFGATRVAKFRGIDSCSYQAEQSLVVGHGDVFIMGRESQNFFQHSIIPDKSQGLRISVTLRQLKPANIPEPALISNSIDMDEANPCPQIMPMESPNPSQHDIPSYTLYIGDSIIKKFDCNKLSSASQRAEVFTYPGAKVCDLLSKIRNEMK